MSKVTLRCLVSLFGPGAPAPGQIFEADKETAKRMIEKGFAEPVTSSQLVKKAIAPTGTKRGRPTKK